MKTTSTARVAGSRTARLTSAALVAGLTLAGLAACTGGDTDDKVASPEEYTTREVSDGKTTFVVVDNPGDAPTLSYGADGSITLLSEEVDGKKVAFKDMNGNGELDVWEDWRKSPQERAEALAEDLTMEQIAGLMLFSAHEMAPADGLTDAQKEYLRESHVRAVLNAGPNDVEAQVTWANAMQSYVESLATDDEPYIPVNFSSDPRSTAGSGGYNAEGDDISRWPSNLGLASTFDVATMEQFAAMSSAEYRAIGITTALGPQIDLATEPRWLRVDGTYGEDAELGTELTKAYVEGLQGSTGVDGWGPESVNTMIKHWPGDGPGESGRESHTDPGKYAVYPGGNFEAHLKPFLGSLDSAAVMTSYSIALDGNGEPLLGERVGTAYNTAKMDLLRKDNGYEGVVVTDWGVTRDPDPKMGRAKPWGGENLTVDERHYAILKTGHDMFGGNNEVAPLLAAHEMWQKDYEADVNDVDADTRFRESGKRILQLAFQPGIYENPYLDLDESRKIVASEDKVKAGYEAQLHSAVLLKNDGSTIAASDAASWKDKTVYIPRWDETTRNGDYKEGPGLSLEAAEQFFGKVVTDEAVEDAEGKVTSYTAPDLTDVDVVLVGMTSPQNGSTHSGPGKDQATGSWYPLSLQYRPYTADGEHVRKVSISGDVLPDGTRENRAYFGNTSQVSNEAALDAFERAVAAVEASGRDIPVVTVLKANNPTVPTEFESRSDAILVGFGISDEALIEVALGLSEPQGRLPIAFPASMDAVEKQLEDVAGDTEPYVDSAGNTYEFGFGLNFTGPITD
ncbi:glycoside hydrolase family 3 C-terminal domain-containing protein [Cellulomonas iranensis]|uniref:glycoside hydrolase family 3 protein n=1 Tax=Cellulomonas iranensis TaxID=76862 RepID=UPI001CF55390|nr:glycoside hydrolase family 3 N-terminal domain-containing protein [Cellulomonas iranensis]UCN13829.1 glycoside hydrolase family 3 C-terminal domain-containing protein [Cellulomonas iranensis]